MGSLMRRLSNGGNIKGGCSRDWLRVELRVWVWALPLLVGGSGGGDRDWLECSSSRRFRCAFAVRMVCESLVARQQSRQRELEFFFEPFVRPEHSSLNRERIRDSIEQQIHRSKRKNSSRRV